jgi:hypothetical protein
MKRISLITTVAAALVLTTTACNRNAAGPETQTTTGVQPKMESKQIASSAADVVGKPAKGTTGTPTIETTTELNVKEMTVSSVTPSGERCAPEAPTDEQQPERRIK